MKAGLLSSLLPVSVAVISLFAYLYFKPSPIEFFWLAILVIWILLVIFVLAKRVARWQNFYVARKVIHILTGGVAAFLAPHIFESPAIPLIGGLGMFTLTFLPRLLGRKFDWFQVEGNWGEVWFCLTWTAVICGLWYLDLNAGVASALFMAVGDGVTGIVRNKVYGRWSKGVAGSIAMLLVSLPIGWYYKGVVGLVASFIATLIEKWKSVDDNITVPLMSALVMVLLSRGIG
ncbi:MAG: dolichol kinase [Candidatus Korarchaeum sp.]